MNVFSLVQKCVILVLSLQDVALNFLTFPDPGDGMFMAQVYNISCPRVQWGNSNVSVEPFAWSLSAASLEVECFSGITFFNYSGNLSFTMTVEDSVVTLTKECDTECRTTDCRREVCHIAARVKSLQVNPPSLLLDRALNTAQDYVNAKLQTYLCDVAATALSKDLINTTTVPPRPPPSVVYGPVDVADMPTLKAVQSLAAALPLLLGMHIEVGVVSNTTFQVQFSFPQLLESAFDTGINVGPSTDSSDEGSFETFVSFVNALRGVLSKNQRYIPDTMHWAFLPGTIRALSFTGVIPEGAVLSVDMTLSNLSCGDNYICSVNADRGVLFSNLRMDHGGDVGQLFTNYLGDFLADTLTEKVSAYTRSLGKERFDLPMRERAVSVNAPPMVCVILYVLLSSMGTVYFVRRSTRTTIATVDGDPSVVRLLLEDTVLCVGVFVCIGGFLWSNCTTGASVIVGGELQVYTFSLLGTARDLWSAGLIPLSICVFVFSGVYPYFKLMSILLFTVVLQRPHSRVLHVIDLVGKFSLIDTFVMVILVSGLTIVDMVEVNILPSFYLFIVSTLGSLLLGNYATLCWRRREFGLNNEDSAHDALLSAPEESPEDDRVTSWSWNTIWSSPKYKGRIVLLVFSCLVLLPPWLFPTLLYRFGGLAPLITKETNRLNLFYLSLSSGTVCFWVMVVSVLVIPLLFAWFPKNSFFISWYACDVFALACVASLLQLNQFVQFVLGGGADDFYNAHASLLWPMFPFLLHPVVFWVLVLNSLPTGETRLTKFINHWVNREPYA
ncbi:hypothetical protein AGDE_15098 [Angomonas deanei]|uniref:Paraquat-inducible protein A, putative n=1 Tax=Angomonas deanei TaxID=59799 RepID=A0A7G2CPC7_9TRYP|nr:hypothetical protein AGDE_15098 [Angomonas deanei]CAD2221355.1 Paraquat-inducible protein A, putative [Angomonas deanei]|eukprot:EPY19692.1 hypothetical protein AGDE_15098 [Angomonas deanei]